MSEQQPPHAETIQYRINDLGWSEERARTTPVGTFNHADGSHNIAHYARDLEAAPSLVQRGVRQGLDIDDAVEAAWRKEGKL